MPEDLKNISRYQIESEIGRGSMGIVYQARDPRINRLVALKVVDLSSRWIEEGSASAAEEFRERFIREAQIAGKLSHPGIVIIYDAGEENELCFIAMEYVAGPSLKRLFRENYVFSLNQITTIIRKAASALDYAHSMGIVHRDIKPGNIIIKTPTPNDQAAETRDYDPLLIDLVPDNTELEAKLVDFGIARFEGSDLTKEGLVIGSPSYMSPEQIRGKRVEGSSDQFSLGVVAYELITGQKPFTGDDIKAIGWQIVSDDPAPPSQLRKDLPAQWDHIILRALEKQPEDRFSSVSEFADSLISEIPKAQPEKSEPTRVGSDRKPDTWRIGSYRAEPKSSHSGKFDPDSSPPWAESSIVDSIIQSKTLEARGWTPAPRKQREKDGIFWLWYILILCIFGGIIFTLILWLR